MTDDNYNAAAEAAKTRRANVSCCIGFFCFCLSFVFLYIPWRQNHREQLRVRDLPITIQRAEPIIAAITQYKKEKGKFPATLKILVPAYLKQLPEPGPVAENGWHYRTKESLLKDRITVNDSAGEWVLAIWVRDEYSPNLLGFGDVFAYHPSGNYSRYAYGGGLHRFQNWGYYVE